jgi:hypothetical protein
MSGRSPVFGFTKPKQTKTHGDGSRVQRLNADIALDRLVETLMEPVGRQARWQVAEAIRKADR